jgi:DNA-binding MarR family transcriptional regulator
VFRAAPIENAVEIVLPCATSSIREAAFAGSARCKYTRPVKTDPATQLPCACSTARKASRSISRIYDAALANAGVTSAQFPILRTISHEAWTPLNQLASRLFMERTSLYRTLRPMVTAGWVIKRGNCLGAGHAKQILLTPAGAGVRDKAGVHWSEVQTRLVGTFGANRWALLQKDLIELAELARELGE